MYRKCVVCGSVTIGQVRPGWIAYSVPHSFVIPLCSVTKIELSAVHDQVAWWDIDLTSMRKTFIFRFRCLFFSFTVSTSNLKHSIFLSI